MPGWYGLADPTASVGTRFGATDGDQTTGGQISFGLPNSTNRALGLLATSTTGYTAFGAKFINGTSQTLNFINLQFTGEVWRQSDLAKTLEFYYFIDPSATNVFSTSATAYLPALECEFPNCSGRCRRRSGGWHCRTQSDKPGRVQPGHHQLGARRRALAGLGNGGSSRQVSGFGH